MDTGHLEDIKNHFNDGYKFGQLDATYATYGLIWLWIDSGMVSSLSELSSKLDKAISETKEEIDELHRII